jgi:hypothetical protein
MIETWAAMCPHCHIVWNVWSREDPRFTSHPSEMSRLSLGEHKMHHDMHLLVSERWLIELKLDRSSTILCNLYERVSTALLNASRASRLDCIGEGEIANRIVLNGTDECDALVEEAMVWHRNHPSVPCPRWAFTPSVGDV